MQEIDAIEPETRLSARAQSSCFACGPDNPHGLRLKFDKSENSEMTAEWSPERSTEGFDGIVHGGIVSTVLDEAMAKAVVAAGLEALTDELRVRFRRHVVSGSPVRIRGWIESRNKRVIKTEAALTGPDGTELAHAWASFLALK
jgi:acyl-coenzyme A thioesterase PaaI-like protein